MDKSLTDDMIATLLAGGEVKLPGLGKLLVRRTAPRTAGNFGGKPIEIPEGRRVAFVQSGTMKRALNPKAG